MRDAKPVKCIGILGRLLGHRFRYTLGEYAYKGDHCLRCGMPVGGWPAGCKREA